MFRTVPTANTLVRWVNENAFASIVQARPCPTFGRPVPLRGSPPSITARYCSSCPSDSTSRWTPCPPENCRLMASGPPWLVSGFRFRARLGFSIPSTFSGPRGVTPAFGYSAPHSSARGTSTLLINALLSAHRDPLRLPGLAVILTMTLEAQPPPSPDLPQLPRSLSLHAVLNTPADRTGACRFLPCPRGLPRLTGGSASTTSLSRPAQASLALRPAGSLPAQRRTF